MPQADLPVFLRDLPFLVKAEPGPCTVSLLRDALRAATVQEIEIVEDKLVKHFRVQGHRPAQCLPPFRSGIAQGDKTLLLRLARAGSKTAGGGDSLALKSIMLKWSIN